MNLITKCAKNYFVGRVLFTLIGLAPQLAIAAAPLPVVDDVMFEQAKRALAEHKFNKSLEAIGTAVAATPIPPPRTFFRNCFMSYAWGVEPHERLVRTLGTDLQKAGIRVHMDSLENGAGSSICRFTELIDTSDYIILAGSTNLMTKYGNVFSGAVVNLEITQIFTKLRAAPQKVIPILLDGNRTTSLPSFLRDVVYIDFSRDPSAHPALKLELISRLLPEVRESMDALTSYREDVDIINSPSLTDTQKREIVDRYQIRERDGVRVAEEAFRRALDDF